jgi:hypothetical protein
MGERLVIEKVPELPVARRCVETRACTFRRGAATPYLDRSLSDSDPLPIKEVAMRANTFRATWLGLGATLVLGAGCDSNPRPDAVAGETQTAASADWIALFDGSDLSQWRGFRRDDVPASWRVEDGTLAFTPLDDGAQRGDLITREQFSDFELELEWRISPGGNSGIMYRVSEDHPQTWHSGPEMQVLDDDAHQDGITPMQRSGALYDLIAAPDGIARPAGEWNQVRIVLQGDRIQQWLNGRQTADIEIGSDEWNRIVGASKFGEMPGFAANRSGHIALQDHGDAVWFRNVRIRPLGGAS